MTDTTAPVTAPVVAPVIAPPIVPPPDGTVADLTARLADANTRAGNIAQQLAALTSERDTLRAQVGQLEPVAREVEGLRTQVQTFTNTSRESALLGGLQAKLPGADPIALKGVVLALAERGDANRFPEDAAAEVARLLPLVSAEAPGLARPPATGGGSPGARVTPAQPARKSLVG